ncbi:hypothetical protein CEXT_615161 [Caerostris extrusa]|uniref:Uncharacterized protein n=1 Tax=Caerostris extrusa TaxID=172846 RepID=A0AAV4PTL2_CAEEX|nr:hypothetical protein CEXT_615161 [Caerostris extrusa]
MNYYEIVRYTVDSQRTHAAAVSYSKVKSNSIRLHLSRLRGDSYLLMAWNFHITTTVYYLVQLCKYLMTHMEFHFRGEAFLVECNEDYNTNEE